VVGASSNGGDETPILARITASNRGGIIDFIGASQKNRSKTYRLTGKGSQALAKRLVKVSMRRSP
jgi:hypothetical protein